MRKVTLGLALIIISCTYEPTEENFVTINQDEPTFSISLHNFNDVDTIKLYANTSFQYDFSSNKGYFNGVVVFIDDLNIFSSLNPSGSFSIDAFNLGTGFHQLRVQFQNSSGTGSLLDQTGGEGYQIWKSWVLDIDVSPPQNPNLQVSVKNGFLNLNWDEYTKPNFSEFRIAYTDYGVYRQVLITDPKKNNWIDSTFLVGERNYTLQVKTNLKEGYWNRSFNFNYSSQTVHNPSDSTLTSTFNSSPLYGAFEKIEIYEGGILKETIIDPATSIAKIKISKSGFLLPTYMGLKFYAKKTSFPVYQTAGGVQETIRGNQMQYSYNSLFYNKGANSVYAKRFEGNSTVMLIKLDANLKGVDSVSTYSFAKTLFDESKVCYTVSNSIITLFDFDTKLSTWVPLNHTSNSSISEAFGSSYSTTGNVASYHYFSIGNGNSPGTYYFSIKNLNTNSVIYTDVRTYPRITVNPYGGVLSENGKFIKTSDNKLYKINASNIEEVPNHVFTGSYLGFRPDKSDEFLVSSAGQLIIYDCYTNSLLKTVGLSGYSFISYDPATQTALFRSGGTNSVNECKLININTNQIVKTIIANETVNYNLVNGYLVAEGGRFLKVL